MSGGWDGGDRMMSGWVGSGGWDVGWWVGWGRGPNRHEIGYMRIFTLYYANGLSDDSGSGKLTFDD